MSYIISITFLFKKKRQINIKEFRKPYQNGEKEKEIVQLNSIHITLLAKKEKKERDRKKYMYMKKN